MNDFILLHSAADAHGIWVNPRSIATIEEDGDITLVHLNSTACIECCEGLATVLWMMGAEV